MRYRVAIEVAYLAHGGRLSEHGRRALEYAITVAEPGMLLADLTVAVQDDGTVVVSATLAGVGPTDLTSPRKALDQVDSALDRALLRTGMFEEFDVSRKRLRVAPDG